MPRDALAPGGPPKASAPPGASASAFLRFENDSKAAEIGAPPLLAAPNAPPLDWPLVFALVLPLVLALCGPLLSASSRDWAVVVPGATGLAGVSPPVPDRFALKILLRILAICVALPYFSR